MVRRRLPPAGRPSLVRPHPRLRDVRRTGRAPSARDALRPHRRRIVVHDLARRRSTVHRRIRLRCSVFDVRALAGGAGAGAAQVPASRQQRLGATVSGRVHRQDGESQGNRHDDRRADRGPADRAGRAGDQCHLGNLRSAVAAAADHRLCTGLRRRACADRRRRVCDLVADRYLGGRGAARVGRAAVCRAAVFRWPSAPCC